MTSQATSGDTDAETWIIQVGKPPDIKCPPWCVIDAEQHRADLWDWEGLCIHLGYLLTTPDGEINVWNLSLTTFPDGSAAPGEQVNLYCRDTLLSPAQARAFARQVCLIADTAEAGWNR